ncbi:MAG: hypothetical protein Barrevirus32_1, partial [Barrevirus sp.]
PIDPKFKEEIEKINSDQAEMDKLRWLNSVSNDPTVSMYSLPGKAFIVRKMKPCKHITYLERAKGYICTDCCEYSIQIPEKPLVFRVGD